MNPSPDEPVGFTQVLEATERVCGIRYPCDDASSDFGEIQPFFF
jgi:hypothetical protein